MDSLPAQPSQNIQQNTPTQPPFDDNLYNLRKDIFKAAMWHDWKRVHNLYKGNERVQDQKITSANDTVLHVAISGAKQNTVLKLLQVIEDKNNEGEKSKILYARNKHGDTPLHLAAALGLEKVCHKIANMIPEMVTTARNNLQETPLFMAVRHGKKNAFFVLEAAIYDSSREKTIGDPWLTNQNPTLTNKDLWLTKREISHCRRHDGNNILHYAIKGEQFDLAYEIIHLYPELMHYVNASGESALHTLANKPSLFESGTRLGFYDTILYYCTITKPLKIKFNDFKHNKADNLSSVISEDEIELLPQTYKILAYEQVSVRVAALQMKKVNVLSTNHYVIMQDEDEHKTSEDQKQRWFPPNYEVAFSFFKIINRLLVVLVIVIGSSRSQSIAKLKQKHRNAVTIMEELVDQSKLWECEDARGSMQPTESISQVMPDIVSQFLPPVTLIEPPSLKLMEPPPVTAEESPAVTEKPPNPSLEGNQPNQSKGSNLMIAVKEGGRDMMKEVLKKFSLEAKNADKKDIIIIGMEEKESTDGPDTASPVLVAAKRGIKEMVQRILHNFPVAILDQDKDDKNIVLLAVEHRQVHVYDFMLHFPTTREHVFGKVDKEGNNVLHLAASLSQSNPWNIPVAALQMQLERKWYKYVLSSVGRKIFPTRKVFTITNDEGKTAQEVFTESHAKLMKDANIWLTNTSQSCTVVATLVATVAFVSASTVPGGFDQTGGFPILLKRRAFQAFAITSLVAFCFSITSLVIFLAILTSSHQERDFDRGVPVKLIVGLTCLFTSIASTLVSFCTGDFFVVAKSLEFVAYPIYAMCFFVISFFIVAQFPYIELIKATIKKVPERNYFQNEDEMQAY